MTPSFQQWESSWHQLGIAAPPRSLYALLLQRYDEPHRHYHTRRHLEECLAQFALLRSCAAHPAEVALALWFHDAIYDVKRHDNEERSAEWARTSLKEAGAPEDVAGRVHRLIMATRHRAVPQGADEEVLVDVDLAILGASLPRFDEYEKQIRDEYHFIPDVVFRGKRVEILKEFLSRETIFSTRLFQEKYERRARDNLARSLKNLSM